MLAQADRNKKPPLLKSVAEAIHGSVTKIVEGDCYDLSQFPLCLTVRFVLFDKHLSNITILESIREIQYAHFHLKFR